jgi:hypothetical protein
MKSLQSIALLVFFANATFAQIDSVSNVPFSTIYNQSCATVAKDMWISSGNHQRVGWLWNNVKHEFENSELGNEAFLTGQKQTKFGLASSIIGISAIIGSIAVMYDDKNPPIPRNQGLGLGLFLGGYSMIFASINSSKKGQNNLEKALWLRNRDELANNVEKNVKENFINIYNTETIYFRKNGFFGYNGYTLNQQKHKFGLLGNSGKPEFTNSINGLNSYLEYQKKQKIGFSVYSVGLLGMISSFGKKNFISNKININQALYFGSIITTQIGIMIMKNGLVNLRQAVFFRNKDILYNNLYSK